MSLLLLCVWSGRLGEAGQRVLIDSRLAYSADWASSRRSGPVWPLSTAHFHNISGVSALQAGLSTEHTHTHIQTLYPLGAMLRRWSGPCVPSRVWCEGERRKHEGGREKERWESSLQPITTLSLLMEKVTALLLPFSSHCNCSFRSFCLSHLYYSTHQM